MRQIHFKLSLGFNLHRSYQALMLEVAIFSHQAMFVQVRITVD
jgi:hypothetical protein